MSHIFLIREGIYLQINEIKVKECAFVSATLRGGV